MQAIYVAINDGIWLFPLQHCIPWMSQVGANHSNQPGQMWFSQGVRGKQARGQINQV